jgi:hypothetical protein
MELSTLAAQIAWIDKRNDERHRETSERLVRIEEQVRETNGRVTRHDEQIKTLFARIKSRVSSAGYGKRDVTIFLAGGMSLIAAWKFVALVVGILR